MLITTNELYKTAESEAKTLALELTLLGFTVTVTYDNGLFTITYSESTTNNKRG